MSSLVDRKEEKAIEYIQDAIDEYDPASIQVGFSGGSDSMVATHLTMNNFPNAEVFHINTGIGIEKTRQFVRDTCESYEWDLNEIHAKEDCNQDYEEIVKEYGFPGPPQHSTMYIRLKERCIYKLKKKKTNWGEKVIFVSGVRHDESLNRMGYQNEIIKVQNSTHVWVNPIYWFTNQDKYAYKKKYDLPTNPVVETLGFSGECLCGAYSHPGEKELVRVVEPQTAEYLDNLEDELLAEGIKECKWENSSNEAKQSDGYMPMCSGCEKNINKFFNIENEDK